MLALLTTVLGRGLAPALPGTAAGIEGLIEVSRTLTAIATVNLFFLCGMLTVWLAIASLAHPGLPTSYRLGILPATATVVVLGIAALVAPIEARWLLWMAVISGSVMLVAVPGTLASSRSRAVGFVFLLVGIAAFLQVLARMLAVQASDEALATLFRYAQAFSTLGFLLHIAILAIVGLWLGARRWVLLAVSTTLAIGFSMFVAWAGAGGGEVEATTLQVLVNRTFDELTRHPIPYVPALLRHAVDVLTWVTVALTVGAGRRSAMLAAATGLALLGSGNADIPLCAVMLTLGALLGPLAPLTTPDHEEGPQRGSNRKRAATPLAADRVPSAPSAPEANESHTEQGRDGDAELTRDREPDNADGAADGPPAEDDPS